MNRFGFSVARLAWLRSVRLRIVRLQKGLRRGLPRACAWALATAMPAMTAAHAGLPVPALISDATTPALAAGPAEAIAPGQADQPPVTASTMPADYQLGPSDRVTISVYGEDDLSREYVVSPAGTISLPLIGEIVARGRTADALRGEITRKLGNGYINNPTVTVMISAFRNFYILGEVNKPGEYAFESGLTVTQAVAEAAGYTYRAARRYAFVRHEGETTETRMPVTAELAVRPGDTIRVGERYF